MQATLEYRRKVVTKFPKNALKNKNKVKEGGALGLGVKKEQKNTEARAQKMMRGRVEPYVMPTLVSTGRQNVKVPQMSSP